MKIIEITALSNGAHNNQTTNGTIPVPELEPALPEPEPTADEVLKS